MGILKQLLGGGGYGNRHGYDKHGSRHGQRSGQYPYGEAPANAAPPPAMIACNACGVPQAAGGRFCGQCGASLTPPACPQCRATLAPGTSFCGQCGTRAQA